MVGGHGTAGAFGPVLEDLGVSGATTLCTAAATFGLVAGSLIGGPIGRRLIVKHDLLKTVVPEDDSLLVEEGKKHERHFYYVRSRRISACTRCRRRHGNLLPADYDGNDVPDIHRCDDCCRSYA